MNADSVVLCIKQTKEMCANLILVCITGITLDNGLLLVNVFLCDLCIKECLNFKKAERN